MFADNGSAQNELDNMSPDGGGGNNNGFKNWRNFKKFLGPAGADRVWHHIVEQCQANPNRAGFANEAIQNINNIINISKDIHKEISRYYSSIDYALSNMRVRDFLNSQTFEYQKQFGIDFLEKLGVIVK